MNPETALLRTDASAIDTYESRYNMTRDQVDLVKRTIAKGTTDDELSLFLMTAKRQGLDPFAKQIYAIKRKSKNRDGTYSEVMIIVNAIDGYRAIAERTKEMDGQDGPLWCAADGVWCDVWLDKVNPPAAAKVEVWRKGASRPFTGVVAWHEFYQDTPNWNTKGSIMLAKCAEAQALRKAFPQETSGTSIPEEVDGEPEPAFVRPEPPAPVPARETTRQRKALTAAESEDVERVARQAARAAQAAVAGPSVAQRIEEQVSIAVTPAGIVTKDREAGNEGRQATVAEKARADYEASAARVAAEPDAQDAEIVDEWSELPKAQNGEPRELAEFRAALESATPDTIRHVAAKFVPLSKEGKVLYPYAATMRSEYAARDKVLRGGAP